MMTTVVPDQSMSSHPESSSPSAPKPDGQRPDLPLHGWSEGRVATPIVDGLCDEDLEALNRLLPWRCFTVDGRGRRFGDIAWSGKRGVPQLVPDPRIVRMHEAFDLRGKHVLELGCFEGVHTVGLCQLGARVTAVDARIENVVKTVVRAAMFGCRPEVSRCDVEHADDLARLPHVDLVHHVGVLYHLLDPVAHLRRLLPTVRQGILLDTHVARAADELQTYSTGGSSHRYHRHAERGKVEVFSGMYDHAKWLLLDDVTALLRTAGFAKVDVLEQREERNGLRVRLHASRTG